MPGDDAEFAVRVGDGEFRAEPGSPAYGRVDLLSVIAHELGHVLGLPDRSPSMPPVGIMTAALPPGVRRVPTAADFRFEVGGGVRDGHAHHATPPVTVAEPAAAAVWGEVRFPAGAYRLPADGTMQAATGRLGGSRALPGFALHVAPAGGPAGPLVNGGFEQGLAGWVASDPARVTVNAQRQAVLTESLSAQEVSLYQDFLIPHGAQTLAFTLSGAGVDQRLLSGAAPDAVGVALLNPATLQPLMAPVDAWTDAYYTRDLAPGGGRSAAAARVTVAPWTEPGAVRVIVPLDGLGGQAARLFFRLLAGSDPTQLGGAVAVADVVITGQGDPPPPVITTLTGNTTVDEGGVVTLTGAFTGAADQGHEVVIDWGDGARERRSLPAGLRDFVLAHPYANNPLGLPAGRFPVNVSVISRSLGVGFASADVQVNNVTPTITRLSADPTADRTGRVVLAGAFDDPGMMDSFVLDVHWGDGRSERIALPAGSRSFQLTHDYTLADPTAGTSFTVRVRLADDGGVVMDTRQIVLNAGGLDGGTGGGTDEDDGPARGGGDSAGGIGADGDPSGTRTPDAPLGIFDGLAPGKLPTPIVGVDQPDTLTDVASGDVPLLPTVLALTVNFILPTGGAGLGGRGDVPLGGGLGGTLTVAAAVVPTQGTAADLAARILGGVDGQLAPLVSDGLARVKVVAELLAQGALDSAPAARREAPALGRALEAAAEAFEQVPDQEDAPDDGCDLDLVDRVFSAWSADEVPRPAPCVRGALPLPVRPTAQPAGAVAVPEALAAIALPALAALVGPPVDRRPRGPRLQAAENRSREQETGR
jgi:hypothetical protein